MGEKYVGTYRGCDIYYLTPPDVPDAVYYSPCISGHYYKMDAVKKRICQKDGGTWVDGACEFPPEPEEPELIETYRGVEIWWKPAINAYWAQVAVGNVAVGATLDLIKINIDELLDYLEPPPEDDWTFLLEPIHDWFDALWDKVVSTPLIALNSFWTTHIQPKLEWVRDQIDITVNWVYEQLEPIISGIVTDVAHMRAALTTSISNMWTAIANDISDIGDWVWGKIKPMLNAVSETVTSMWNDLSVTVSNVVTSLVYSINNAVEPIITKVNTLAQEILSGVGQTINDIGESLWTSISTGFNNVSTWITTSTGAIWDSVLGLAGDLLNGMGTKLGEALGGFWDWLLKSLGNTAEMIFGAVDFVVAKLKVGVTILLGSFLDVITGSMSPGSPPKEIKIASDVLMQTSWQKQLDMIDKAYQSEPTAEGLQQSAIDLQAVLMAAATVAIGTGLAADIAHPFKGMGFRPTVREMVYWSGIPAVTASIATAPTAIGLLTPLRYALMERWTPMIPASDDIIRFSVREVYLEERREALLMHYPGGEYERLMAKQGFKPEFSEHYWMAHWVLPSVSQLNEMLYRDIITIDVWMKYVEYNDYIPEMVPNLQKIIYSPYTRVDIRRMWDIGLVTDEELYENYLWLGYDDEHAKRMTLWTKAYVIAGDVRALYSKGWINEDGAREMLINVGVPKERVDVFMMRLVKSGQADRMSDERDLTKTDILKLLKLDLVSQNEAMGMLQDLGYDEDEAYYLIQVQMYAPDIELKELTQSQILRAYTNEVYTRAEAKNALMEAGWSDAASETLLELEDIKRKDAQTTKAMEKELSRTDIIKGINKGVIDVSTGHDYLGYLGYSEWEINFIFALEDIA